MLKINILFLSIFLVAPFVSADDVGLPTKCLSLGEESSVGGVPMGGWKLDPPCCEGLIDRETIRVCDSGYAGGYAYVCLQCGDKICDPKIENNCNCPEDCPKTAS